MQLLNILRQADIFYGIPKKYLTKVVDVCQAYEYKKGDIIVKENTPSNELYIITEGVVEIIIDPSLLGGPPMLNLRLLRFYGLGRLSVRLVWSIEVCGPLLLAQLPMIRCCRLSNARI